MNKVLKARPDTFKLFFLGCRVNQYEVQSYRNQLQTVGLVEVREETPADLCIINTCAVTASAESASRNIIRRVLKTNPDAQVVITGCFVESDKIFFQELERCTVVSNKHKDDLVGTLFPVNAEVYEKAVARMRTVRDRARVFIKVQDGCNSFCSYCLIPYLRGRSCSRNFEKIIREIRTVVASGYREVVITGINVGDYRCGDENLASLVRAVNNIEGLSGVRISSIDPEDITEDLSDAVLNGKNICPSMHLVLQSGSNSILKRMNRKYTRADFLERVERLRLVNPDFSFTTDVIVGFPGETDSDFRDTLNMVSEVGFTKVHIFPFSRRKRTKAYDFEGHVPDEVIKERKRMLHDLSESTAFFMRERFVGQTKEVLVEEVKEGIYSGHTPEFIKIRFTGEAVIGRYAVVGVNENGPDGLLGEVTSQCFV